MIHGTKIFATLEFAWTMVLIGIVFPVGLLLLYLLITDRRKNTHSKCTQV
jgi:heme/copper-type cytochrome/quinol oxidase subunit 2